MNTFAIFILPFGVVFIVSSFSSQLFGRSRRWPSLRTSG
jgi:hypothetical protein